MSFLDEITVLLLTYNEASNIDQTLASVSWAKRILIVDSGSSDETLDIIGRYKQAEVVTRSFDTFANQCNFGLSRISSQWVLSMDADYRVSAALAREIEALTPTPNVSGFMVQFVYCIYGAPLRATLYPPRCVLYRRERARYRDEGHGHRVMIEGRIAWLSGLINHDDRKPLSRWLGSQQMYARREAEYLMGAPRQELGRTDRIRLIGWPAPILVFVYTLLWKRCILDGWPGWVYALQRTLAETLISLEIIDRRLRSRPLKSPGGDRL